MSPGFPSQVARYAIGTETAIQNTYPNRYGNGTPEVRVTAKPWNPKLNEKLEEGHIPSISGHLWSNLTEIRAKIGGGGFRVIIN